MNKEITTKV